MATTKHTSVWLIIPQTNLHVGNESIVNFSVIDKAVQRDVTTNIPCINSSSLKGAVKEYLHHAGCENIKNLFGSVKADPSNSQKGSALFFDATLLAIPEQKTGGDSPYKQVYNDGLVDAFLVKASTLGANVQKAALLSNILNQEACDYKKFESLCSDDNLPIIARNCLENGESVNLWYEQVLPSQSVLATIIQTINEDDLDMLNGKIVQIGANATIGYGYCKFIKL
jgi:CRISPR-associated protein Cmr4